MPLAGAALVLAACSDDPANLAETLIETEIEEQLGLGELTASCDQPDDLEVGTQYTCAATTDDERVVEFLAEFTGDDMVFVQPTNVLPRQAIDFWKQQTAALLSPELPIELDPALMACSDDEVVFLDTSRAAGEASLDCTYPDPAGGPDVPLRITLSGFVIEEGYQDLSAAIGDSVE